MRKLIITMTVVMALCLTTNSALAVGDPNDAATCAITASVDQICEWEGANFAAMECAILTSQADTQSDSETYTLWVNCNVELTADNTETNAQLEHATSGDYLVTKYKISTDGAGVSDTGATTAQVTAAGSGGWIAHDDFLSDPGALGITHYDNDGAVEITLEVQATNDMTGHYEVADAGNYGSCTQTITAGWTSD